MKTWYDRVWSPITFCKKRWCNNCLGCTMGTGPLIHHDRLGSPSKWRKRGGVVRVCLGGDPVEPTVHRKYIRDLLMEMDSNSDCIFVIITHFTQRLKDIIDCAWGNHKVFSNLWVGAQQRPGCVSVENLEALESIRASTRFLSVYPLNSASEMSWGSGNIDLSFLDWVLVRKPRYINQTGHGMSGPASFKRWCLENNIPFYNEEYGEGSLPKRKDRNNDNKTT